VNVSTQYNLNPGVRINTSGEASNGVFAETRGDHSHGVYAETYGLFSDGAYAETHNDRSDGMHTVTHGYNSDGVYAATNGDTSNGVTAYAYGPNSEGVHAYSAQSEGVIGDAVSAAGVKGQSTNKAGIWGVSTNDVGVYGQGLVYGVYTNDKMYAKNGIDTPSVDVAEYFPATAEATAGTVVVIGEDRILTPCTQASDPHVAGIVSTAPGVSLGTYNGGNTGEALIAVAGRVPCKVDASNGPIHPGDLLTTSSRPGYAMKASPVRIGEVEIYPSGIIIGKAYGTLESGTGMIEVIVTLQ
jgi:hypothetical protein